MIQIRKQQFDAFKINAIENYIDRVVEHLGAFFPDICADLGEQDTREVVRYGIDVAQSHGIDREVCVCEFVDLLFIFGIDFDTNPQLPWAREILLDERIDEQGELMDHLWESGIADIEHRSAQGAT